MARQLAFDLPVRPALGREDFFVSDANAAAVARIEGWRDWPLGKLALCGPAGSGKTHLAHVWATLTEGLVVPAGEIDALDPGALATPLAVDGLDAPLSSEAETTLFHIHNTLREKGLPLLLTGREGPARWPIRLPDLASRLSAADTARIEAPDDALLSAVILKQFTDRGIEVSPQLIDYLVVRIDRSFETARRTIDRLDTAALERGRPITRRLAAEVLALS